MKAPAPMRAKAPGSTHAHGLGGRKTPAGALQISTNYFSTLTIFAKQDAFMRPMSLLLQEGWPWAHYFE